MPPKLNLRQIAQVAQVEPEFVEILKQIWKERWKTMNDDILSQPPQFRQVAAKDSAPIMNHLQALCTNKAELDKEITRLRGLPYERFFVLNFRGRTWLAGLTRPIVMSDGPHKYQAPRYTVYIPNTVCASGTGSQFHFVPEGHELTSARHPHHKAYAGNADHPTEMQSSTCWGSFGTIISSCSAAGDIVDLFRNIAIYLTRIDKQSLLVRPFDAVFFLKPYVKAKVSR